MSAQDNSSPVQVNPVQSQTQEASSVPTAPTGFSPIVDPSNILKKEKNTSGAQQTPGPQEAVTPPPPKKGLPKIVPILGVIVLVLVLFFVVWKLILPKMGKNKEVTLTWWGLWEDSTAIAPLIAEYEQQNPNVKINYVKQSHQD